MQYRSTCSYSSTGINDAVLHSLREMTGINDAENADAGDSLLERKADEGTGNVQERAIQHASVKDVLLFAIRLPPKLPNSASRAIARK